jgi:hypothetical protein
MGSSKVLMIWMFRVSPGETTRVGPVDVRRRERKGGRGEGGGGGWRCRETTRSREEEGEGGSRREQEGGAGHWIQHSPGTEPS